MQEGSLLELLVVTFLCGAAFGAAAALCYAHPTFRRLERLEERMRARPTHGETVAASIVRDREEAA